jgi:PAS domain S-box-containing protein
MHMNQFHFLDRYRLTFWCGLIVALTGLLVLLGWHFDILFLKAVLPGYTTMKVNSALALIAFALALLLLTPPLNRIPHAQTWGRLLTLFGGLIGFATLLQYIVHIDLRIDELFYKDLERVGANYSSGRLAPITAINFILLTVGFWMGPLSRAPRHRLSQTLFFITALSSFQALIEYVLGMQTPFGNGAYTRIAIHTAISFILLSVGLFALNPHRGLMRIFLNRNDAGTLARRLVIALIAMPPIFKFLILFGEQMDLIDGDFSTLLRTIIGITFFVMLVLRSAESLQLSELLRKRSTHQGQLQEKEREKNRAQLMVTEAVQTSEARLRMIFSSTFDAIVGFDSNALITEWNLQAEKIFGWERGDVMGKNLIQLLYPESEQQERWTDFQMICNTYDFSRFDKPIEVDTHTKSGKKISVRMGISYMHISGDLLFIASIQDITEQLQTQRELIRSREQALIATRSKSEFLANMSHEIRTPMNGVIGMSTVLLDSNLTESQRESAKLIKQSAESLLNLINGILDHSKIEAGKLELDHRNFDFVEVVQEVVQIQRLVADEKGIPLKLILTNTAQSFVIGDAGRLRQILLNLVGNAIKFTESGEVVLKVHVTSLNPGQLQAHFEVIDTGPGLSDADMQKLFHLYGQTETGSKKGGTGLGLYISGELVRLMGGRHGVHSQLGIGSTFWFEIDFPVGEKTKKIQSNPEPTFLHGHVLVAEDQLVNQRVVGSYLAKLGVSFDIAANGAIALQMLENSKYDLILMDCRMPIMDGYETTTLIREKEKATSRTRIPIIALSAEISTDDRQRCLELGMDEFLGKPLGFDKLVQCLLHWLPEETEHSFVIDEKALKKLEGYKSGDQSLISALIAEFSVSAPQVVDDMHLASQNADLKSISDLAHALKSTSATLGLLRVAEMCQTIETLKEMPPNILSLISRLEVEVLLAETDLSRLKSIQLS